MASIPWVGVHGSSYIDKDIPEWARPSVQWTVESGIFACTNEGLGRDDKDWKILCWMHRLWFMMEKVE